MIPKEFSNHVTCLGPIQHKSCLKNKGYNSTQCSMPFVLFCEVPAEVLALEVVQSKSILTSIHRASGMNGCSLCTTSIRATSIILQSPQTSIIQLIFSTLLRRLQRTKLCKMKDSSILLTELQKQQEWGEAWVNRGCSHTGVSGAWGL